MAKNIVILGAGISGLSVGVSLAKKGHKVTILEKEGNIGGLCASFKHKEFITDLGPHKIYSQLPGMMPYFKDLLGKENQVIKKRNSLALLGKYFVFPPQVIQMLKNINLKLIFAGIGVSFSFIWAITKGIFRKRKNVTYEDYFRNGFGKKGYNLIFRDYAWKVWGNPKYLSEEIARKRTPIPNIPSLIKNIIFGVKDKPDVSAEFFYYPKYGIQGIADKLAQELKDKGGKIILNALPHEIGLKANNAASVSYYVRNKLYKITADSIVSSIHIDKLPYLIKTKIPEKVKTAAGKLKYRSLILSYFILNKEKAMKDNWIFFPEKKFIFNRVSEQKSFSKYTCPKDKTLITAEVTCDKDGELSDKSDTEIVEIIKKDLVKASIIKQEWIEEYIVKRFDKVYPVYSLDYKKNLQTILHYLDTIPNIISIGRPGLFNYNNMDHCIDMARIAAEHIDEEKTPEDWIESRKYFDSYRIVD